MHFAKIGLKLGATVLSVAVLTACGSGGDDPKTPTPTVSSAPAQSSVSVQSSSLVASSESSAVVSSSAPVSSSSIAVSSVVVSSSSMVVMQSSSSSMVVSSSSMALPVSSISSSSEAPSSSSEAIVSSSSESSAAPSSVSSAVASSSSEVASSSSAPVSSSSSVASSSSEVASSSSIPASSSSASGSLCKTAIDAGEKAYQDNCALCHTEGGALFSTGEAIDIKGAPYGRTAGQMAEKLDVYIETYMAPYMSSTACAANKAVCADNVAAYLKSTVNVAWCPGDDDMSSSSAMTSSSETVVSSSSDVASSSDAPVSSSSIAVVSSSSEMSSSSVVESSSSMMMVSSSSEVMSSSSVISSSSAPALQDLVEFVYPTQKAHLGGAIQTKLVAKIIPDSVVGTVQKITIGGVALELQNGMWISTTDLNVAATDAQEFDVLLEMSNGDIKEGKSLVINNLGGATITQAGADGAYSVRGLAFDTDDNILYYSNPFDAQVSKYNSVTGGSDVVYQGTLSTQLSEALYWPIAVDSASNTVYLSADSFSYSNTVGSEKYDVKLVVINDTKTQAYSDLDGFVDSSRGLVLDLASQAPMSGASSATRFPTVYSLDFVGQETLQRWFFDADEVFVDPPNLTPVDSKNDENNGISAATGPLAITSKLDGDNTVFLVAREHENELGRGNSALVVITSTATTRATRASSVLLTELDGVNKPTALAYSRDGQSVYVADTDRIWLVNLTSFAKEIVTSSNIYPAQKGTGPRIGGKVTAMALHPTLNYLYLAADTGGIIMVDLATGNRITIVK